MITRETVLNVSDNTGAKQVRCIGLYKSMKKASIGDIIMVTVIKAAPGSKAPRKIKKKAIIIRTRKPFIRQDMVFRFADNAVILLNEKSKPIGNRCFGATVREVKKILPEITNIISKIY